MDLLPTVWQRLTEAAGSHADPMRNMVLCTVGGYGRTVVLREVDEKSHTLHFYSDARADKVAQLGHAEAVAYEASSQWQLRARGTLSACGTGPMVDAAWEKVGPHGRENYRGHLAPGTSVSTVAECARLAQHDGRIHFVRLTLQVVHWDMLWLHDKRRARAHALGPGHAWQEQWVQM